MHLERIELTNFRQHKQLDVDFHGNLIAVLGPNGCLAKGTPVRMFDGSIKPVEEIKSGDVLLAYDEKIGVLTSSTVSGMIMTSPNQKQKPMLEVELNGEKTCTTYDHPFFGGDGFYPLYQLIWGAMEASQRSRLKLLCEQYGAPFDDTTIWQQNSCRDEACPRQAWVLQDHARWSYREGPSDSSGKLAAESTWSSSCEPYRLQSIKQQGGKPGVVLGEVQCVVWGNPWQHKDSEATGLDSGRRVSVEKDMVREACVTTLSPERGVCEKNPDGGNTNCDAENSENFGREHSRYSIRAKVLEAATYYTIRMREAPYTYCIGRRNCYLTHNCGKSNLIGAIQFALTGEQPGFQKADLTTWGEKEGSVRLFFTAGAKNERFCITRKTNGDVVLKVGDETIKQARKVEDALRERAGLDKDLIRQVVFVNQKEIDKILSADPKDREMALQRIAGIAVASKIYDYLRPEIAAYDKPQGFDEAIARAKVQLSDQKAAADACHAVLARYEEALKALPGREDLEAEVDRCAGADSAVSEFARLSGALERAQDGHEKALAKLAGMGAVSEAEEEKIRTESSALAEERERLQNEQSEAKDSLRFLNRMKELADAASKSKVELEAEQARVEEIASRFENSLSDDKAEADRLGAEQVAAESELRSLHNLVQSASSDGTCPVCGAAASQEDIERHLAEKMSAAERKARETCEKAKRARMAYDKRQAEESAAREAVERKRTANDVAFAALKKAHDAHVDGVEIDLETFRVSYKGKTPDDIPSVEKRCDEVFKRIQEISSRTSQLSLDLAKIASVKSEAKGARDDAARLSAQIDVLVGNKRECAEKLAALGIDPASVALGDEGACSDALRKARENLNAYNGILQDMAAEKGKLNAAEQTIESTQRLIDDLVEKKSIEESVQARVDTLKRTRDWFHYKVGPRIVSQCVMKDLTESVNMFLDQFNAPFVVDADEEGCGFRCRFIDGRTMPDPYPEAHMLSGGQKVALAFAFHIAIYMRFGGQLGFLSLDEPTAYLDDSNIEHMGELLEKVGAVARNKGLQILMATHEKAIMPFLDTKIDLGAMKGE